MHFSCFLLVPPAAFHCSELMDTTLRLCSKCHIPKPLSAYRLRTKDSKNGKKGTPAGKCDACMQAESQWRAAHKRKLADPDEDAPADQTLALSLSEFVTRVATGIQEGSYKLTAQVDCSAHTAIATALPIRARAVAEIVGEHTELRWRCVGDQNSLSYRLLMGVGCAASIARAIASARQTRNIPSTARSPETMSPARRFPRTTNRRVLPCAWSASRVVGGCASLAQQIPRRCGSLSSTTSHMSRTKIYLFPKNGGSTSSFTLIP